MNVTELARKLKVPTKELLEILPAVGFGIGKRAIKIDDRQAQRVIDQWPRLLAQYRASLALTEEKTAPKQAEEQAVEKKPIAIPSYIRVKDLATKLGASLPRVMAELMKNGVLSSMNEEIDFDTAAIIGQDLGFEIMADAAVAGESEQARAARLEALMVEKDTTKLKPRPPVVVVMGHVDHGKTKLLDAIRQANVIEEESGGITQHIGAYQAEKKGKLITFIDTPGHEVFTTMRSRGARVADVAILVIAADDSIQPQTKESIKIIKSAELPMVVAINKIDKADANPDKVKQDLATLNLIPEDLGGKTITVPISAKTGVGLDELLDMILLVAETEQEYIMANPDRPALGTVIESHIDKGEGPVASVIVQNGTFHRGDQVEVADSYYGKIRTMKNFIGEDVVEAPPSMPVKILGLKAVPSIGDILRVVSDVDKKKKVKRYQLREQAIAYTKPKEASKEEKDDVQTLNIVLKADVLGSLEAIIASLTKLDHPEVSVNIVSKGLGNITEGDIERAEAAGAWLVGFHVKMTQAAELLAKNKKVEISRYDIIYKLIEEVAKRLEALLKPDVIRTDLGRLKVLAAFAKDKNSIIVGGTVSKGSIRLNAKADVMRNKAVIASGTITQLQENKINVSEVATGKECGLKFAGKPVIAVGDTIEVYQEEVKEKKLH